MDRNSMAIIVLCSHLCVGDDVKPLEPAEWTGFAEKLMDKGCEPHELMSFSKVDFEAKLGLNEYEALRVTRLIERSGSIGFEIEKYANMGINIITRADAHYPRLLKKKLGKSCPPIFYYAGNPALTDNMCIGFVGSRSAGLGDETFTAATVRKVNANGYTVVSGGAKGIDSIASDTSTGNGSCSVEYVPDSLVSRIKPKTAVTALVNNQLLLMSAVKPDSRFYAGFAMMRNNFIYAQSEGTVVVKSDYNKGGTWSGAVASLKKQLCSIYCWNNPGYKGNIELIRRGAIPIDESWTGDVNGDKTEQNAPPEQISLFG